MGFKINMKRKEFEDVNNEDGFSSTFPPCGRKYRRLNGAGEWIFSPYAEDDEPSADASMVASTGPLSTAMDDVMSCLSVNIPDEKAIVLYNPHPGSSSSSAAAAAAAATSLSASNPLLLGVKSHSSADFPIVLDSGLIPGLKECISWPGNSMTMKHLADEMATSTSMEATNTCLALVPWVESQSSVTNVAGRPPMVDVSEPMEAEGEAELMDIEDGTRRAKEAFEFSGMGEGTEGFQHWQQQQQQQHHVRPPFLQNSSSPVSW